MGKLLININIVQTQLWEKPIYNLLSSFRKQHVPSRLFIRIFFFFFWKGGGAGEGTNQASQNNSFRDHEFSMCPIQLFQTRFQLHCRHKNFNSCCKEHLKGNRDRNVFCAHFTMDPDSQLPVWCRETTYKKCLKEYEIEISSDLNRSNLQNFPARGQPWWRLVGHKAHEINE